MTYWLIVWRSVEGAKRDMRKWNYRSQFCHGFYGAMQIWIMILGEKPQPWKIFQTVDDLGGLRIAQKHDECDIKIYLRLYRLSGESHWDDVLRKRTVWNTNLTACFWLRDDTWLMGVASVLHNPWGIENITVMTPNKAFGYGVIAAKSSAGIYSWGSVRTNVCSDCTDCANSENIEVYWGKSELFKVHLLTTRLS